MNTIDGLSVKTERGANVKRTRPENGFCNVIDGEEVSGRKKLPVVNPAAEQSAVVPHVRRAFFNKAVSEAQTALFGMGYCSIRTPESNIG